jgi:predicted alpha/beta superfamily hydrolase
MRERRAERRMVDDAREVARRIAAANGEHVVVDFLELAGEDHASAVAASLTPALRLAARVR